VTRVEQSGKALERREEAADSRRERAGHVKGLHGLSHVPITRDDHKCQSHVPIGQLPVPPLLSGGQAMRGSVLAGGARLSSTPCRAVLLLSRAPCSALPSSPAALPFRAQEARSEGRGVAHAFRGLENSTVEKNSRIRHRSLSERIARRANRLSRSDRSRSRSALRADRSRSGSPSERISNSLFVYEVHIMNRPEAGDGASREGAVP